MTFIKEDIKPDKEVRNKRVQEAEDLYNLFIKTTGRKLTQAQAYSFAMRILTEILYEIDEPKRTEIILNIPNSLTGGLEMREIQEEIDKDSHRLERE